MPNCHTWKQSQRLAPRILRNQDVLAKQLRSSRSKLAQLTRPGGKLAHLAEDADLLPVLVWTYVTKECRGPAYESVKLAASALNYLTSSTNVRDLLSGRDPVEDVFSFVCRTIAPDLKDFQRWKQEHYREA